MKAQMRDTFVSMKAKGWLLDDVEIEEPSGSGVGADCREKGRIESKVNLWEAGAGRVE